MQTHHGAHSVDVAVRRRAANTLLSSERPMLTSFPNCAPLNACGCVCGGPEVAFECVCAQNDQSEMKVGYLKLCSRGSGNPAFIWFLVFPSLCQPIGAPLSVARSIAASRTLRQMPTRRHGCMLTKTHAPLRARFAWLKCTNRPPVVHYSSDLASKSH